MLMIMLLFEFISGVVIAAMFDDGDPKGSKKRPPGTESLTESEYANYKEIFIAQIKYDILIGSPNINPTDLHRISEEIYTQYTGRTMHDVMNEAAKVAGVLDPNIQSSRAEKEYVQSKYLNQTSVDNSVQQETITIYKSFDPAEDGDNELEDAWSFESEIENVFGPEQMAISEEDIAPESSLLDLDITEPTDEISQSRETVVSDETVSVIEEIEQIEETTPFESVIYPDVNDIDLDPTDNTEEFFYPIEQYDITEDDYTEWPEQELDDMANELEVNAFQSAAWTFDQDMSQEALTGDDTYQDIGQALDVIDFEDFLNDTASITLDIIPSDHLGVKFFQWIDEPPGGETLDVNPF